MPTSQKVQIDTYDFGASLTVPTLGALDTGTTIANGTAATCNEQTVDSGVYIADFVGVDASALIPAGTYRLRTAVNGLPLKRFVTFAGVDGEVVYARSEEVAVLDTDTLTILNNIPTTAEFEARTLAAASYATAAQINSLNVNTRANISVPIEIETPDSGTQVYKIRLFLFDIDGNMEAPDSTPTVALVNAAGTDRSSRLSSASNASTGVYSWDYTATDDDAEEQLNWTFTVVEGGLTRVYPATSYVVEETAYRFTSTDRSTLNSRSSQTSVDAISTNIGTPAGASVSADIAAVKADTDSLLTRITSGMTALISNLTAMITGSGASAKYTVGALSNAPSGGGGSGTESDLMVSTTIATLTSQTVFTLTDGSADNDAYNDQLVVITDASTSTQKSRGIVSDYVGATKTVTLRAAPGFTIATGDGVAIMAIGSDVSSTQLAGAVSSAVATAGVATTVTGIPTFLRVGDARTVANGGAISVRLYDADDDSLLFGLGTQLFADATITFSLRRGGNDGTEGTEDAVIPCTWVASGGDGYVQIAYEGDALDGCDAMDKVKEKDCHRWGIKFQWGSDDPITPVYGTVFVLRKIVSTQ